MTTDLGSELFETFSSRALGSRLKWFNEPSHWEVHPDARLLRVTTDADTDFWQRTHYGFERDNGHFLFAEVSGDFVLTAKVTSRPVHQYDQAGLMLRLSPACWVKTSIEYEPEESNRLGVVVTNRQFSDWSTQPIGKDVTSMSFRIRKEGADCIVDCSPDGGNWQQLRIARLIDDTGAPVKCGLYACSPKGAGYQADFQMLSLKPGRLDRS